MRKLIKQLNHAAEHLTPENKEIFRDIVVYIRTSNLKTRDVEEFLHQMLDSFLTAQSEGITIQSLLGTKDIKSYCKNIVDTYKASYILFSQIGHYMTFLGSLITILAIIGIIDQNITLSIKGLNLTLNWNFTLADLSSFIYIGIMVIAVFTFVKTTCFRNLSEIGRVTKTWLFAILSG